MKKVMLFKSGRFIYSYVVDNDEVIFVPALNTVTGYVFCALSYEVRTHKENFHASM